MLFRTAETQLIKAEALCRLGKTTEAKEALNKFKQGRYLDIEGSYTESDLLNEILKERKLEFYHEQDVWWLDMNVPEPGWKESSTVLCMYSNRTTIVIASPSRKAKWR